MKTSRMCSHKLYTQKKQSINTSTTDAVVSIETKEENNGFSKTPLQYFGSSHLNLIKVHGRQQKQKRNQ